MSILCHYPARRQKERIDPGVYEEKGKYVDTGFSSMNGNIVVLSSQGNVTVDCSDNNTPLKDTQWFKDNRTPPKKGWAAG